MCEGDSAKAGVISGLSKSDRNTIGVYPMKGKLFNVRGETQKKISENKEIAELKKILGLESGKKYTLDNINTLRYGKVLFMTDQDLDGTHIKGLGLNLFQHEWLSLLSIPNFIGFMNTPILKATKGSQCMQFYNEGEYEKWKQENNSSGWKIKYYKGLGTSTGKEFKEYFENKKIVTFSFQEEELELIDMVFNKKRASDRKLWLGEYNRDVYADTTKESISYKEFINQEMIHYSKYDCERSIPSSIDGFKISQRKILFAAFKKGLTQEIKVAQFSGYVSEHSGYHHGEASLNGAIVNMAQNFVGSNNVNLFCPNGQFGTRLQGGKDSASERYIFTKLHEITRLIFKKEDDPILKYINDDGQMVEPIFYAPIIPMILVNGAKGIGTGFSTDIIPYHPIELIEYIQCILRNKTPNTNIKPYYHNFLGTINKTNGNKYIVKGIYKIQKDSVIISELPIGMWTDDYKQYLETLLENKNKYIKDYNDNGTERSISIEIIFHKNIIPTLLSATSSDGEYNELEKLLKLYSFQNENNMHLFNHDEKLIKYESIHHIIVEFYKFRLNMYQIRKDYLIKELNDKLIVLVNKCNYIKEIIANTIDLRNKSKSTIDILLLSKEYVKQNESYNYLLRMPMDSVNSENVLELTNEKTYIEKQLAELKATPIQTLWDNELTLLKDKLKTGFKF